MLYKVLGLTGSARRSMLRWSRRWLSDILPYQPMKGGQRELDAEYSKGLWDYLGALHELSRFNVVAGYSHYLKPGGHILEIGCGAGTLQERLCQCKYSRYVGVDISAEAIKRAVRRADETNTFVQADADAYRPDERFDVIIFNECLEYFADPLSTVRRYEPFLEPDGIYIVSMFVGTDTNRTRRIWKMLHSAYTPEAETQVSTRPGYTWIVKVFAPLKNRGAYIDSDVRTQMAAAGAYAEPR